MRRMRRAFVWRRVRMIVVAAESHAATTLVQAKSGFEQGTKP